MDTKLQQKTERETQYMTSRREFVESPTVGSTQERAYQQQLVKIGMQKKNRESKNAHSFTREEDIKDTNGVLKNLQLYDSLEDDAHPFFKRSLTQFHKDTAENKSGIDGESKIVSEYVCSELCYDLNMMSNMSGDGSHSPKITTEAYCNSPKGSRSHIEYFNGKDSVLLVLSHTSDDKRDQLDHHHPQDGHIRSSSPSNGNQSVNIDDPTTPVVFSDNQNKVTLQTEFRGNSECDVHPEVGEAGPEQGNNKPKPDINLQPGVTASKKLERQEDIVERNKITLGRNTFPGGSYMMAYAHKQGIAPNGNKICKEKKCQQKEPPSFPLQKEQPSGRGVIAEQGDCLNPPAERLATVSQPETQWTTSLPPNCHLNVNKPAHLLPLVEQRAQDAVINKSHPAYTDLGPASVADQTLLLGYQETDHEKFTQMSQHVSGTVGRAYQVNRVTSPVHRQRIAAVNWVSSSEENNHMSTSNEFQCIPSSRRAPKTPTTPASLSLGSDTYSVLPPVGMPTTGVEFEISPGQSASTADNFHRSSSDSYLGQMGKQKQLGATYKAYSLKDYNQLQLNISLRGLGPDYKAVEEAAEKMRRQRLYSNVIREQNKKISRIPILPAKNLQSSDKKVPRIKALEYAKTIVKPSAQPQAKQKQQGHLKDHEEQAPATKGLEIFPPDKLALLLKRHEQEKKAAAQRVNAV